MKMFYGRFQEHSDKRIALQASMQELRERYPHPYYWAPFILVGRVFAS
jgi:CHAT domain-containing protein